MRQQKADQTSVAAFWVKGIADTLGAAGLDVPALFKDAALELAALDDPDARFQTEGISLLWQLAATPRLCSDIDSDGCRSSRQGMRAYAIRRECGRKKRVECRA